MVNKAHNDEGAKGYRDYIIGKLDKDQIRDENPTETDFEPLGKKDMLPSEFTESGTDYPADGYPNSDPELPVGKSMDRFAKKHEVPESAKVQGANSGSIPKFAQTDDTASGNKRVPKAQ